MESCAVCGKQGQSSSIKRCSRCKTIRYCSTRCQSRDWPRHKVTCRESSVDGPITGATAAADNRTQSFRTTPPHQPPSTPPHQPSSTPLHPFANPSGGTYYITPWQEARSRAQEAFPGQAVTSDMLSYCDFRDLETDFGNPSPLSDLMPSTSHVRHGVSPRPTRLRFTCGKVVVLRLVEQVFDPLYLVWLAEDCRGVPLHATFMLDASANYFRFIDLQEGHFLCIKGAAFTMQVPEARCIIALQDPSLVRVFRV